MAGEERLLLVEAWSWLLRQEASPIRNLVNGSFVAISTVDPSKQRRFHFSLKTIASRRLYGIFRIAKSG
jgi:hypothetical protein